ncbi:MAG: class I SAM-dependent methyltransferase [Saprospiraceae bacterium]|nr:class I SAM-dependent methyltransferase [Saprospiraceae bacterium]
MSASERILQSWQANAENWIQTIDHQEIESRNIVTNQAILATLESLHPHRVLDVGCGEGWLTRHLSALGMDVVGIDAIPALITNARAKGVGNFMTATYSEIANGKILANQFFDTVIINFALIDKEETEKLLHYLPQVMPPKGHLVIQTLHPLSVIGDMPYQSGWQAGSWQGMKRPFTQPYDWYFRTLGDWVRLLQSTGLALANLIEPIHPKTQQPVSIILVGRKE